MADVCAANPEDDIGGDVGGVVGDTFEAARDHQAVHCLLGVLRLFLDELEQVGMGAAVHAIDFVVHFADCVGEARVAFEQGLDGGADHAA